MPQSQIRKVVENKNQTGVFAFDTKDKPVDTGAETEAVIFLNVLKNSGVMNFLCDLITQDPITGNWVVLASFPLITTTGTRVLRVPNTLGKKLAIDVNQTNMTADVTWDAAITVKG